MDSWKNQQNIYKRGFHRLIPVLSQILFILTVWEFLRWSASSEAEETVSQRKWRLSNPFDCFHKYSQRNTLRLNSIMSRAAAASQRNTKEVLFVLDVDIFIGNLRSGSLTIYPAGATVFVDVDFTGEEQVWSMEYFEYNDDEIASSVIYNNFVKKEYGHDGRESGKGLVKTAEIKNNIKAENASNDIEAKHKTDSAMPTENPAIDVMLLEDEMLKVRSEDQLHQHEIMQLIKKHKVDQFMQQKRILLLKNEHVETNKIESWFQKKSNMPNGYQNNSEIQLNEDALDGIHQNLTKDGPLAWPDVVLDEGSEPLYTDGFLERVQKAKSELYAEPKLYDQTLKEKVKKYYLLNNAKACAGVKKVDIVYLIHSQPQNQQQRQLVRDTIVKSSVFRPFHIVYVFLLGKTTFPQIQDDLRHESKLYRDLVQGNFDDTASTNVWKSLMGMRWALQYCRSAHFVLKINEDVLVDTDKLLRGLIPTSTKIIAKRAVFCSLRFDKSNTNNSLSFPKPYCDGFAILMTRHLVCSIVAASHQIRVPSVEDYYLYGVLLFVIGGAQVYNLSGNTGFQKDQDQSFSCFQEQADRCPIVATQSHPGRFMDLWNLIRSRHWKPESWSDLWDLRNGTQYFS